MFTLPKQVNQLYTLSRIESILEISESSECSVQQPHWKLGQALIILDPNIILPGAHLYTLSPAFL